VSAAEYRAFNRGGHECRFVDSVVHEAPFSCGCYLILKPVLDLYSCIILVSNLCAVELYKTMLSVKNYILHG
jgi:hypothetical protein